jgi:hypothetical protein
MVFSPMMTEAVVEGFLLTSARRNRCARGEAQQHQNGGDGAAASQRWLSVVAGGRRQFDLWLARIGFDTNVNGATSATAKRVVVIVWVTRL